MVKILIVDDEEASSGLLAGFLEGCGYRVSMASNVPAALKVLQGAERFDVMILDYMMPGQTGLELMQWMGRDATLQRPAIVLCSAVLQGAWWPMLQRMLPQDLQDVVQAFVIKPFTLEHMRAVLQQILAQPRRPGDSPTMLPADHGIKILMTEDDEASGWLVLQELRARGYAAGWCRTGSTCWEALGRGDSPPIDLLILDLRLPDIQGEELLSRLGAQPDAKRIRVIVVSGHLTHGDEKAFLERLPPHARALVSSILIKPFDLNVLHQAIDKAVVEFG